MDAMTGRGELGARGLVATFYGRGGLADGRTLRSTEAWTGRTGVDWGIGGRSGLRNPRRHGLRQTGRVGADRADYGIADGADGVDWGGWGGLGQTGRTGADGADWGGRGGRGGRGHIGSSLEGRKGRIGKLGAGVTADWADRLGYARPVRLASSRLRAEGIPGVLSPDADYGVI